MVTSLFKYNDSSQLIKDLFKFIICYCSIDDHFAVSAFLSQLSLIQ